MRTYEDIDLFSEWSKEEQKQFALAVTKGLVMDCLLYTSPSPRDLSTSRMPSSA